MDPTQAPCGETQCNGRGTCRDPKAGGDMLCDCTLGYKGERCEDTVNESLSVSLTLGVLTVILGVIFLAFLLAKLRQKQKRRRKLELMKSGYQVGYLQNNAREDFGHETTA